MLVDDLDDLIAESQIRALHLHYRRAADRLDRELFRSCFHDDAVFEFPVYAGGVEGSLRMACDTLAISPRPFGPSSKHFAQLAA